MNVIVSTSTIDMDLPASRKKASRHTLDPLTRSVQRTFDRLHFCFLSPCDSIVLLYVISITHLARDNQEQYRKEAIARREEQAAETARRKKEADGTYAILLDMIAVS